MKALFTVSEHNDAHQLPIAGDTIQRGEMVIIGEHENGDFVARKVDPATHIGFAYYGFALHSAAPGQPMQIAASGSIPLGDHLATHWVVIEVD